MPHWHALNPNDHGNLSWQPYTDYRFAALDTFVPLVIEELAQAQAYYPLCFIEQPTGDPSSEHSHYQLMALQSLTPGLNLYVSPEGRWLAPYIPAHYRSYPFSLQTHPQKPDQQIVCIDRGYPGLVEQGQPNAQTQAHPFFTPDQQPAEKTAQVIEFLQKVHNNRLLTQQLVDQLQQADLIEPWPIQNQPDAEPITGLYRINEAALKALAPETLSQLAQTSALGLAYGQLLSQVRLNDFQRRYQQYASTQKKAVDPDLEQLFGESHEDIFKF